jgi:transposase
MATLQKHISRGHAYWSIVESRRIDGKPRPVILLYLGRADDLLKRLTDGIPKKVRSYQHGDVAILLDIAEELGIVQVINKYVPEAGRQLRDGFTVGGSILLAAIGRASHPTSKNNWYEGWAKKTSLSYLLGRSVNKLDSQHFWDQMEALPVFVIPLIEEELVRILIEKERIELDTLLYDTSNFFTYIDSTNTHCTLAQRGKNKQKRMDLRQLGLLLLISRQDHIPLFHKLYQGNLSDRTVFKEELKNMIHRIEALSGSLEDLTIVFDQGNNSKDILRQVSKEFSFVGALSPHHHKELIQRANKLMKKIEVNDQVLDCYYERGAIWGLDLSIVVLISEKLRQGQIRGIHQQIKKIFKHLQKFKDNLRNRGKYTKKKSGFIEDRIKKIVSKHPYDSLISWNLSNMKTNTYDLDFCINEEEFTRLKEQWLGRRILITNRHEWSEKEIILAYYGQAHIEQAFKAMKNPFHLALRPQYHWTDQKIEVHAFICLLSFLLSIVAYKRAKERTLFKGSLHNLLEKLSSVRLSAFIEAPHQKTKGRYKVTYQLEEMDEELSSFAENMGLTKVKKPRNIPFSVYI